MQQARCYECRAGEHDDISDTALVLVRSVDGGPPKRMRLCEDHIEAALMDGSTVERKGR